MWRVPIGLFQKAEGMVIALKVLQEGLQRAECLRFRFWLNKKVMAYFSLCAGGTGGNLIVR